ncbi:Thymidylate kinase [Armadillidium vulgare]|nr:Thymidylate kinase [Armadillidium vulgare]
MIFGFEKSLDSVTYLRSLHTLDALQFMGHCVLLIISHVLSTSF